jgi:hypothetical protein
LGLFLVSSASRNSEFAAAEIRLGQRFSNHVAGMNRNAESLRRLGDLHEAWVFRCPKGRTPPGCTTPRQWGRTPPDAARHSAPEGRAGGQLEDPRAAGDSELHFIQVSSCSATVCHGGPGCSAHPVRRNAMTHLHFPGPAGEKNAGHSQQTLFWFKLTRKCQCFPKLSQCMTPTHRSLPHQLSPARDQQQCHGGVLPGIIMSSSTRGNGVSFIQTANLNERTRRHTQIHKSRSRARIRPRITHSTINFGSAELGPHSAPARSGDSVARADPPAAATANVC